MVVGPGGHGENLPTAIPRRVLWPPCHSRPFCDYCQTTRMAIVVGVLGIGRNAAVAALAAFVAAGWWILRKLDDSEREWNLDDLLVLSDSPDEIQL